MQGKVGAIGMGMLVSQPHGSIAIIESATGIQGTEIYSWKHCSHNIFSLSVLEEALQSHKQWERSLEDSVEAKAVFNAGLKIPMEKKKLRFVGKLMVCGLCGAGYNQPRTSLCLLWLEGIWCGKGWRLKRVFSTLNIKEFHKCSDRHLVPSFWK